MTHAAGKCLLCGSELGQTLLVIDTPDRFEKSAGVSVENYRREWRECPGCGAAINQLPPDALARLHGRGTNYYEVDFAGSNLREKYDRVMNLPPDRSDNAGRAARVRAFLAGLATPPVDGDKRILDIGAGLGVFLSAFLQPGWKGVAVEPDPLAAAHLRSLGKFEVIEGLFDERSQLGEFDCITLNKVIEHLADPLVLLRDAARSLRPIGDVLYVEVPDRETIGRRKPGDNILGALHWHLYSPRALAQLLEKAGLFPLQIARVFEPSGKITLYAFAVRPETIGFLARQNES